LSTEGEKKFPPLHSFNLNTFL